MAVEPDHLRGVREDAVGGRRVGRNLAQDYVALGDRHAGRDRHLGHDDRDDGDTGGLDVLAGLVEDVERQPARDERHDDARDDDHLAAAA